MHVYAIGIRPKLFGAYKNILNILCLLKKLPASSGLLKITQKKRYESGPMTFQLQLQQLTWPLNTKQKCRKKSVIPSACTTRSYSVKILFLGNISATNRKHASNTILRSTYSLGGLSYSLGGLVYPTRHNHFLPLQ